VPPLFTCDLNDVTRDGSELLSLIYDPNRKQLDVWTKSVQSGSPRLVIKDTGDAIWSADGRSIFFREELRQQLWASDTFVDFDHSLNTAIKKLRQALGDEAVTPSYIETLPKRGYRFIGEVQREVAKEEPKPETREMAAVAVLPIGQLEPRPSNPTPGPNRHRRGE
jgi:Transcriptional regulatory protein, C terminal